MAILGTKESRVVLVRVKHILIATDGSELAAKALAQGLSLAKALAAQVTVVTVTEPWVTQVTGEAAFGFPSAEYDKAIHQRGPDPVEGQRGGKQRGAVLRNHPCQRAPSHGRYS